MSETTLALLDKLLDANERDLAALRAENALLRERLAVTLDAFNKASQIAWHPEEQHKPVLSNEDRWKIVNLYRNAIASFRR